jgi:hypothetical protein
MSEDIKAKLAAQFKSWRDGSLMEPELLKIYQTIIDDGMENAFGMSIAILCNDLIAHGACTPMKPRPLPKQREE